MSQPRFGYVPIVLVLTAGVTQSAIAGTVTICHFPPGNPANVQVITVGGSAVPAHVAKHNDAVCSDGDTDCCFGDASPSVCTNFQADGNNCGGCGNVCPSAATCIDGTCVATGCPVGGDPQACIAFAGRPGCADCCASAPSTSGCADACIAANVFMCAFDAVNTECAAALNAAGCAALCCP